MLMLMNQLVKRFFARISMVGVVSMAALWPAIALAQSAAPSPKLQKVPPVWLGYLVMFLLLAVVLAISLMPSKRGHQD
jgi:hypothetical protein